MNGDNEVEDFDPQDNEDAGMDYTESSLPPGMSVQAGTPVATAPLPLSAPSRVLSPSPAGAPSMVSSPDAMASREFWRRMHYQLQDEPIAQAEQALNAALRFQAIRGYQKDLESGKSAAESLARWAPMMFSAQKSGGMSGAASLVRASRPPAPPKEYGEPVFQPVPGVEGGQIVYRKGSPGVHVMNPPRPPSTSGYQAQRLRAATALPALISRLEDLDKESPEYKSTKEAIDVVREAMQPQGGEKTIQAKKITRVNVKDPKGRPGNLPSDQIEAALKAGYTLR